jgi:hypothetical protein
VCKPCASLLYEPQPRTPNETPKNVCRLYTEAGRHMAHDKALSLPFALRDA